MPEREPKWLGAPMSSDKVKRSALMEDCSVVPIRPQCLQRVYGGAWHKVGANAVHVLHRNSIRAAHRECED